MALLFELIGSDVFPMTLHVDLQNPSVSMIEVVFFTNVTLVFQTHSIEFTA